MTLRRKFFYCSILMLGAMCGLTSGALAEEVVSGTVQSASGTSLVISGADGQTHTFALNPGAHYEAAMFNGDKVRVYHVPNGAGGDVAMRVQTLNVTQSISPAEQNRKLVAMTQAPTQASEPDGRPVTAQGNTYASATNYRGKNESDTPEMAQASASSQTTTYSEDNSEDRVNAGSRVNASGDDNTANRANASRQAETGNQANSYGAPTPIGGTEARETTEMPATASPLQGLLVAGILLLAGGAAVGVARSISV